MTRLSLFQLGSNLAIHLDPERLLLEVIDLDHTQTQRLSADQMELLQSLARAHPGPLSYEKVGRCLSKHGIHAGEVSCLHRKVSELRHLLRKINPQLAGLIENVRNHGYGISLAWRMEELQPSPSTASLASPEIEEILQRIESLAHQAERWVERGSVLRTDSGYCLDRRPWAEPLAYAIEAFNASSLDLLRLLPLHSADFLRLRIELTLAKLRTYVGLARISDYAIPETLWAQWFSRELHHLLRELRLEVSSALQV